MFLTKVLFALVLIGWQIQIVKAQAPNQTEFQRAQVSYAGWLKATENLQLKTKDGQVAEYLKVMKNVAFGIPTNAAGLDKLAHIWISTSPLQGKPWVGVIIIQPGRALPTGIWQQYIG